MVGMIGKDASLQKGSKIGARGEGQGCGGRIRWRKGVVDPITPEEKQLLAILPIGLRLGTATFSPQIEVAVCTLCRSRRGRRCRRRRRGGREGRGRGSLEECLYEGK